MITQITFTFMAAALLFTRGLDSGSAEPAAVDSFSLSNGKKVFIANCTGCHGSQGQGGVGPNLCDHYYLHGHHYYNIHHVIAHGVKDKGMLSFRHSLTRHDLRDVSHYVHLTLKGSNPPNAKAAQGKWHK